MLGNKVKVLRGQLDLSRKDLAEDLSISYHALSKYETNKREPDIQTLKKMADYFCITIDELLERESTGKKLQEEQLHWGNIPVLKKMIVDFKNINEDRILNYEKILLSENEQEHFLFWYVAEDDILKKYRILAGDRILFMVEPEICDGHLMMFQLDGASPMIRKIYQRGEYIIIDDAAVGDGPIMIRKNEVASRLNMVAQAIKVEFRV